MLPNECCQNAGEAAVSNQSLPHGLAAHTEPPLDQFAQRELLSHSLSGEDGAPVQTRGGRCNLIEKAGRDSVAQLNVIMVMAVAVEVQQKCAAPALGLSARLQGFTDPSEGGVRSD